MAAARTYVDFEPSSDLVEDARKQTLVVNLPGFKKEHLRVQIDRNGRLRVSGERPVEGDQWSRFRKEIQVSDGCDASAIRAKFEKDGVLHVTMPRLTPLDDDPKATAAAAAADEEAARLAAAAAAEEKKRHEEMEQEEDARRRRAADEDDHAGDEGEGAHQAASYGFVRDRSRSRVVRAVLLAVAVALVGVAGMYARYRWMDLSAEMAPAEDATVGLSHYY